MKEQDRVAKLFFTTTTDNILEQQVYKKALYKGANYFKVPEGHKSRNTSGRRITGARLQRHHGCMEPEVRKSFTTRKIFKVENDVEEDHRRRTEDFVEEVTDV
jgi:hypothetical protein